MNATLHHPHTASPNLNRFITASLVAHFVVLIALSLTLSNSIRVAAAPAIQVKLIGVPQPSSAVKPVEKPEEVRTQDSAAPKEPPPEMKNIPPSEAKTKMLMAEKDIVPDKPTPINAAKRPPVLDKNPNEKKVVKNDLSAKVVKKPEDFLKVDEFIDKLAKQNAKPVPTAAPTQTPAGEGPQIQLNASDNGTISAIQAAVNKNWNVQGNDLRGLSVAVLIRIDPTGNLTYLQVTRSSGNVAFDLSLDRAIRKTIPLPIPAAQYEKFKEIELVFEAPK